MVYRAPKGVFDLLPKADEPWRSSHLWAWVEETTRTLTERFGYKEVRTPLFESTDLFTRSIGESSDIVTKEMYTFPDKAGRSLTLRPEGTAPVLRAFIENHLEGFHKLFYLGPMFRYERQQAGRYRQHHQFGVEVIGSSSPFVDAEAIELLHTLYKKLGIQELTLHINSIGDQKTRETFRKELKAFLQPHLSELSEDSQRRFESNPLRILDSKAPSDQKILEGAPSILDFLNGEAKEHFDQLLDLLKIPYKINSKLVRGLDYYNHTVFEFTVGELGAQNSIGGGGRYDGLIKELGGADLPAFGFGTGLERIIQTCINQGTQLPKERIAELFLIPLGKEAERACFDQLRDLRDKGHAVEMDFMGKKLKQAMRYADRQGFRFVTIVGDAELESGLFELKEMESGKSEKLSMQEIEDRLNG